MASKEAIEIAEQFAYSTRAVPELARAIDELRVRDLERELSYMSYEKKRLLKEINTLKAAMGDEWKVTP